MALGRDVRSVPLLSLQSHVAVFLLRFEILEKDRHAMTRGMLQRQGDEDESDTELAEVVPCHGILLVEPLERRGVIKSEASLREPLADLDAELLNRPTLRGWKLAPQEV